ncbi:MAG TPA: DUF5686 family protein [Flavobacteriales bacterium]|nr:DUF5686 family protein [Flavobacteriales bacterium]
MRLIMIFWLCVLFQGGVYAQDKFIITVIDSSNNDPVPFAGIVNADNRLIGTTDLDGKTTLIGENGATVTVKCVGYKPAKTRLTQSNLTIKLPPVAFVLADVTILPGENPAHRLIKQTVKYRDSNNPQKACVHCYNSYNKLVFKADEDTLDREYKKRTAKDTGFMEMYTFFMKQHLFVTESLTEKYFSPPAKSSEKIIANRVSGFENPVFSILATELQSFGYYQDEIKLLGIKYLNPISPGSTEKYLFLMKDTSYENNDTLYTITFEPRKGKSFKGLKGNIIVHTRNYAIKSIKAQPVITDGGFVIHINQLYGIVEDKQWFPLQLNAKMYLPGNVNLNGLMIYGDNKGYITNIRMGDACKKVKTDEVELEISSTGKDTSIARLEKMSPVGNDNKEKNTYTTIDSMGKANNFDKKLNKWVQFATGKIPIGFVNIELNRLLNFNHHEGTRIGLGLRTNYKISKRHVLSGYVGYGFKDKVFKYGGDLSLLFYPRKQTALKISYKNDIYESAAPPDFYQPPTFLSALNARQLYLRKFDFQEMWEVNLGSRLLRHFHLRGFMNTQLRKPLYDYGFAVDKGEGVMYAPDMYALTHAGAVLRFAFREKFVLADKNLISQGTTFPVLTAKYTRSVDGVFNNDFTYERWDLMFQKDFKIRNFGKFSVVAQGGKINGIVPYTLLMGFTSSWEKWAISVPNSFEGMRVNEFAANTYAQLFLSHNFLANLFYNTKNKPQLELFTNMGWGTLDNANRIGHSGTAITLQSMEKGYYESGVRIHSLLKSSFSRIGVAVGCRYGAYSFDKFITNCFVKITTGFVLD